MMIILAIHGLLEISDNFFLLLKIQRSIWTTAGFKPFFLILVLIISSPCHSFCYSLSSTYNNRSTNTNKNYIIKVCQSKTCIQQYQGGGYVAFRRPLARVIQDLIPPSTMLVQDMRIHIESSGCLSQCGYGPNLVVVQENNEMLYNYIDSPQSAAVILHNICGIQVPKILLAASDVMRKAELEPDANKSETLLNSVINALEKRSIDNEESYDKSYAIVSALTMRAKKRLVLQQYQDSIDDALRVVEIEEEMSASSTTEPPNNDDAYRILAEAYEKMGNYSMAIQTLRKSSLINSASATKANNEIKRILALE